MKLPLTLRKYGPARFMSRDILWDRKTPVHLVEEVVAIDLVKRFPKVFEQPDWLRPGRLAAAVAAEADPEAEVVAQAEEPVPEVAPAKTPDVAPPEDDEPDPLLAEAAAPAIARPKSPHVGRMTTADLPESAKVRGRR